MNKYYLQVAEDGIITDAITYSHGNYVEVELDTLPVGVMGGWFKLESGVIVEYPELKPISPEDEITNIKAKQDLMQKAIDDLILGGTL